MRQHPYAISRKDIHRLQGRLERRLRRPGLIVALLGAGGRGLAERRRIAAALQRRGIVALIPEDALPRTLSPSLAEEALLLDPSVSLVFLRVESWGSATELGQLRANPSVALKLRILVPPEHHPLHGQATGYLADTYLTQLPAHGHVYAVDGPRRVRLPSAVALIPILAERFRQAKALDRLSNYFYTK